MSDADFERYGRIFLTAAYAATNIGMVGLGLSIFLSFHTLHVFFKLPPEDRKRKLPFVLATMLILVLLCFGLVAESIYLGTAMVGPNAPPVDLLELHIWEVLQQLRPLARITTFFDGIIPLVGEAILIYRCFTLYTHIPWVVLLPGISYLGALLCYILQVVERFGHRIFPEQALYTFILFPALAVTSNAASTLLILGRLWYMRWTFHKASLSSPYTRQYTAISAVLVESALPLSLAGIVACVFASWSIPLEMQTAASVPYAVWSVLSVLCPQFIIWRVLTGQSWVAPQDVSLEFHLSNPIAFAVSRRSESASSDEEASGGGTAVNERRLLRVTGDGLEESREFGKAAGEKAAEERV
ncbi:hypothetical protein CC2G_000166 [Coprinopsis cinerea AmutBmut pab1-1]|nr:hypothetical protein CC2G_000166 [Coprinopsis cinerea AmutBmut pab1-1]